MPNEMLSPNHNDIYNRVTGNRRFLFI